MVCGGQSPGAEQDREGRERHPVGWSKWRNSNTHTEEKESGKMESLQMQGVEIIAGVRGLIKMWQNKANKHRKFKLR